MQCEECGDAEFKLLLEAIYEQEWWHVDNSSYLDVQFLIDWMEEWSRENGSPSSPRRAQ
jgi:enamine deaminase RidA (YjgF/YER057c/UK114 family)